MRVIIAFNVVIYTQGNRSVYQISIDKKPVFWSGAYFVASCGGVTLERLKQFVENQATPRR